MISETVIGNPEDIDITIPGEQWGKELAFVEVEIEGIKVPVVTSEGKLSLMSIDQAQQAAQQAIEYEGGMNVTKARIMKVMYQEIEVFEK